MSWFNDRNDPLKEQEKLLRSKINQVEKEIHKLEKAQKQVEKGEVPKTPGKNPFDDPLAKLRNRPRLFQNPEDESKFRLGSRESESPGASDQEVYSDLGSLTQKQAKGPSAHRQNDLEGQDEPQPTKEFQSSLGDLLKASREDPHAPTEEEGRFLKYLAAGNVEGVEKLQYDKNVERNRKIVVLILISLIASAIYLYLKQ